MPTIKPLSVAEIADHLQVSPGRVRYLIRAGQLRAWQVGGIWVALPADVRACARRLKADPRSRLHQSA